MACGTMLQVECPDLPTMAECVAACQEDGTPCMAELLPYFECMIVAGPSGLVCDPDFNFVVLRSGVCTREEADLVSCLEGLDGGLELRVPGHRGWFYRRP